MHTYLSRFECINIRVPTNYDKVLPPLLLLNASNYVLLVHHRNGKTPVSLRCIKICAILSRVKCSCSRLKVSADMVWEQGRLCWGRGS